MLVLGINGSPYTDGRTSRLLAEALLGSNSEGADVDFQHLVNHIKEFPDGRLDATVPLSVAVLLQRVEVADALIIATPVHWFNVSSLTKAFVDHLSATEYRDFSLDGKVVGLIAACDEDGGQQALSFLSAACSHLGAMVPPFGMLFHNRHGAAYSENRWQETDVRLVGRNVVRLARATAGMSWQR